MAQLSLYLLVIMVSLFCNSSLAEPAFARHSQSNGYIKDSCRITRYPSLCLQCLSSYGNSTTIQSPEELTQVALSVSLYRAQYTRAYMLKVAKELESSKAKGYYQTVKDCLAEINDSVDQLSQSIRELRHLGQETVANDIFWHISNVETWVSAALTDASTCLDEFPGHNMGKLKATIKGKVLNVAEVTSNALALFHRYAAAKYRAANKKP
ncbi:hypothetical protein SO802_016478 [Lithocarpus litseifolius]|uniref:Pectinesterase inhibitor domain-containing protein n=1 Tax=Lithocarpus litseifolius TaxID=425828 RepID=A0AAW2CX91_9ROSI